MEEEKVEKDQLDELELPEEKNESIFKKIFSELKALIILALIIGIIGVGTWYWYTKVYDAGSKGDNKKVNVYYYSTDKNNYLSVNGDYLVEFNDEYIKKIMDLKTKTLYEGETEYTYYSLGIDGNLYVVLDETGENENTITLYEFVDNEIKEKDSFSKKGVYYAPVYYQGNNGDVLMGFSGVFYTQNDYGEDSITSYIYLLDGTYYELSEGRLFGNSISLSLTEEITTKNDRYIIICNKMFDDNLYGVFDLKDGKTIIEPTYEMMKEIDDEIYVAQKNGKAGIISLKRKILVDFNYDFIDVNDGFFVVGKDGKLAIMDNKYNLITDFTFDFQSGLKNKKAEYMYYLSGVNYNSFAAYKVGNKYLLQINYLDYELYDYEKHEAYVIDELGNYETIKERSLDVKDDLIYIEKEKNKFTIYNDDLSEKYIVDLTEYDFEVYFLELLNENTISAISGNNRIYVDYDTGEIIDDVKEFKNSINNIDISYKYGKLKINEENEYEISDFDSSQIKETKNGLYYLSEEIDNSVFISIEKGE